MISDEEKGFKYLGIFILYFDLRIIPEVSQQYILQAINLWIYIHQVVFLSRAFLLIVPVRLLLVKAHNFVAGLNMRVCEHKYCEIYQHEGDSGDEKQDIKIIY